MRPKIIIVDDDIITLKILKKYLDDYFEVQTENAGYRFVEKMDSCDADLILLDLEMPVVNGLQVFDKILRSPKLSNVPVAFLTGVADPNLVRDLKQKGAAGYIIKTTPKGEIIDKVNMILESKESREVAPRVLIIEGNVETLKGMRETLINGGYIVKAIRKVVDAFEYIEAHQPNLVIVGRDITGAEPKEIYAQLSSVFRSSNVRGMVMDTPLFSSELLEKVTKALE